MCGIAGIINFNNNPVSEDTLLRVRDTLAHRGSDDAGLYISDDERIGFTNRRLAILDLSDLGHQPMISEDRNLMITYNGEIYNFSELKSELSAAGYRFKSNTDTEVILNAYHAWGVDAFEKLNGMFAFCIYDKNEDLVYLVRDHAGIKPLYYSITQQYLIFSSEVKAFKVFDNDRGENPDWKIYLLVFGHIPEPFTTLKNVFMLPKQSFLKIDVETGRSEIKKYTKIVFSERINDLKEAVEQLREKFTTAVKRHLISDAPIGVFLSGGIDSSLIALIAHNLQKNNLRTLSVIFNEKEFSEEKYQNIVSNEIKSKHCAHLVTEKDFLDNIEDIFSAMDQPTVDGINTYFISKCAKKDGLKTVLSGLGGDELFGGYPSFQLIDSLWFYHPNGITGDIQKRFFNLLGYFPFRRFKKLSYLSLPSPLSYYLLFRSIFTIRETARLLNITEKEISDALSKLLTFSSSHRLDFPFSPNKNFVSALESNFYMQNQLLKDTDFMSMWHSIEVRVPFLDRDIIRFVYSISEKIKFDSKIPKFLLMKSFEDILPQDIINRKKQGFTFPFDIWLRNRGRELFEESVAKFSLNDRSFIKSLWNKFENNRLHWSRIWSLVVLSFLSS